MVSYPLPVKIATSSLSFTLFSLIDLLVVLEQISVERHGGRSERSRNLSICATLV